MFCHMRSLGKTNEDVSDQIRQSAYAEMLAIDVDQASLSAAHLVAADMRCLNKWDSPRGRYSRWNTRIEMLFYAKTEHVWLLIKHAPQLSFHLIARPRGNGFW